MQKKLIIAGSVLLFITHVTVAGFWDGRFQHQTGGLTFEDQEWALDLFGLAASRDRVHFDDDTLGVGVGLTYFVERYFGASVETYMDDFESPNHVDLSAIVRYPVEDYALAPYALAGFGRQFHDAPQWTTHLGGGVEYRLNRMTGIFADIRRIFPADSPDLTLFRAGLRLKF